MPRIVIIEDEPDLAMGLRDNLEFEHNEVAHALDGASGLKLVQQKPTDLVLLDIMLPDLDGFEVCRRLRAAGYTMPIIMLTARSQEIDKVRGLELGADDYVTKPFSLRELLARINANMRRSGAWRETDGAVRVGAASVDFQRHRLVRDGQEIECSAREIALLRYLVERRGQVVSRDTLLEVVWGRPQDIATRTVDNFIVRLRKKIEPDPSKPRILLTVHGSGYKLVVD